MFDLPKYLLIISMATYYGSWPLWLLYVKRKLTKTTFCKISCRWLFQLCAFKMHGNKWAYTWVTKLCAHWRAPVRIMVHTQLYCLNILEQKTNWSETVTESLPIPCGLPASLCGWIIKTSTKVALLSIMMQIILTFCTVSNI